MRPEPCDIKMDRKAEEELYGLSPEETKLWEASRREAMSDRLLSPKEMALTVAKEVDKIIIISPFEKFRAVAKAQDAKTSSLVAQETVQIGYLATGDDVWNNAKKATLKEVGELESVRNLLWMADNAPCFGELLGEECGYCPICVARQLKAELGILCGEMPKEEVLG